MLSSKTHKLLFQVYLFERLDSPVPRESIKHLKCLVFVRPTPDNVQLLSSELRNPRYAQYYICEFIYWPYSHCVSLIQWFISIYALDFSNIVSKTDLKTLAESDEHETVSFSFFIITFMVVWIALWWGFILHWKYRSSWWSTLSLSHYLFERRLISSHKGSLLKCLLKRDA